MPSFQALQPIDAYWAADLGCPVEAIAGRGLHVVIDDRPRSRPGAFLLRRGERLIVSLPGAWAPRLRGAPAESLFTPEALEERFGVGPDQVIGPAALAYAGADDYRPWPHAGVRPLGLADRLQLEALAEAAGETAWAHSGLALEGGDQWGRFEEGLLVAAGMIAGWGEAIAHLGILSHPAHRGAGHARAVVAAMTEAALAAGKLAQYRTLVANGPSMAIAHALGFQPYAMTLAVRLPVEAPL